jgi:hypothetical protein
MPKEGDLNGGDVGRGIREISGWGYRSGEIESRSAAMSPIEVLGRFTENVDEPAALTEPDRMTNNRRNDIMAFIQIIEASSTHLDEIQVLMDEWVTKTEGKRKTHRSTLTADRDRPNVYVQIVEFPSYEEAMANSNLPETAEFAARLTKLCDSPPAFRNLDVRRVDDLS